MAELKHTFTSGVMNKDFDERLIRNGEYRDALNIQVSSSEGSDVGAVENLLGNEKISSLNLINAKCIGTAKNALNEKIYWFVISDNVDGIYEYDAASKLISPIIVDTKTTQIDLLLDVALFSDEDGDLLILNISDNELKQIFGIDSVPTNEKEEVLIKNSVSLSIDGDQLDIFIPKGTILMRPENGQFALKGIKNPNKDSGSLSISFKYSTLNVLGFNEKYLINSTNVIDDFLFFTDGLNEPRVIDINKFKSYSKKLIGEDGTIDNFQPTKVEYYSYASGTPLLNIRSVIEDDISVAKKAPQKAPSMLLRNTAREGIIEAFISFNFYKYKKTESGQTASVKSLVRPNDEENTFDISYSIIPDWKINDIILFEIEDENRELEAEAKIKSIANSTVTFEIISYVGELEDKDYNVKQILVQDSPIYELKFPRFAYRWKYNDNTYSTFSPFTEPAFLPGEFKYDGKTGFNEGLVNNLRKIELSNISLGDDRVKEIDILLKFDDDQNIYVFDTKKIKNITSSELAFNIEKERIKSTLPNLQLLRQWDNVPKKAFAQEISSNRIMYGNYYQNYNIYNDPEFEIGIGSREGGNYKRSIKSDRSYEFGVVYIDKFNRQTPVLTNDTGSYFVNKNQAKNSNLFNVKLNNKPPAWATHFKYFIKEPSAEYYNVVADRFYQDNENGFTYVSFPSSERNKITEDTYLILKKLHGSNTATSPPSRHKIIDIFAEAPEFVHERLESIGFFGNVLFAPSYGDNSTQTTKLAGSSPVPENNTIQIRSINTTGTATAPTAHSQGINEATDKALLQVGNYVRFFRGETPTNSYKISSVRYHIDGDDECELKFEEIFGDDVNILYLDANSDTSAFAPDIGMRIYEDKTNIGDAEFDGRFFVKLQTDGQLSLSTEIVSETTENEIEYIPAYTVAFDGVDRNKDNFLRGGVSETPVFVRYGGLKALGDRPETGQRRPINDINSHITFEQTGPKDDTNFIKNLSVGTKIKFSNHDTIYRIGRIRRETYKGKNNSQPVVLKTLRFEDENGNETPLTEDVVSFKQNLSSSGFITASILQIKTPGEVPFVNDPAVFETEPVRQKTDLNIYYETEKTFKVSEHGNIHKLDWYNCFSFGNGVESNRIRDDFNAPFIKNGVKASTILEEGFQEEHKFNGLIWSGIINSKSSVNNSNQFIQAETITKDFLPSYGSIQKLHSWDDSLVVFLENKVLRTPSNKSALFNADGSTNLISSNNVIGNPIEYNGEYGISLDPQSFASFGFRCYFADRKNGKIFRLSKDGLTPISGINMNDFFRDRLATNQAILGSFDERNKLYDISFYDDNDTVCFSESTRGWVTRKSFVPEYSISLNSITYSFNGGELYIHDSLNVNRNNFYGIQSYSQVDFEINQDPSAVKKFRTLGYEGTKDWTATLKTDQESSNKINFIDKENKYFALLQGENKDSSNLDLKKFNFQGIGVSSAQEVIADERTNTNLIFVLSSNVSVNAGNQTISQLPGEAVNKPIIRFNVSALSDRFKLLASNFKGKNCTFEQNGDGIIVSYANDISVQPASNTTVQVLINGKLTEKEVTLSGSYQVILNNAVSNIGDGTFSFTGKPGEPVQIADRKITANTGYNISTDNIIINDTTISNYSKKVQLTGDDSNVTILERTVLPNYNVSDKNYIITATAKEIGVSKKIILSKNIDTSPLSNFFEERELEIKAQEGSIISYVLSDGSSVIQEKIGFVVNGSNTFYISLAFEATDYDTAKTYTLTISSGNNTEFGLNFGDKVITFNRALVEKKTVIVKINHDDSTTGAAIVKYLRLTNKTIDQRSTVRLTLTSGQTYIIDKHPVFPEDFSFEDGENTNNINIFSPLIEIDPNQGHIIDFSFQTFADAVIASETITIDLTGYINKEIDLDVNYNDPNRTNSIYTVASITGSQQTIVGTAGILNQSHGRVAFVLTLGSGYELIPNLSPSNFQILESSVDVTNTYADEDGIDIDLKDGTSAEIGFVPSSFLFPFSDKTLTIQPSIQIHQVTATPDNDYSITLQKILPKVVITAEDQDIADFDGYIDINRDWNIGKPGNGGYVYN
jgi:hypothetical protein